MCDEFQNFRLKNSCEDANDALSQNIKNLEEENVKLKNSNEMMLGLVEDMKVTQKELKEQVNSYEKRFLSLEKKFELFSKNQIDVQQDKYLKVEEFGIEPIIENMNKVKIFINNIL